MDSHAIAYIKKLKTQVVYETPLPGMEYSTISIIDIGRPWGYSD